MIGLDSSIAASSRTEHYPSLLYSMDCYILIQKVIRVFLLNLLTNWIIPVSEFRFRD